jgi:hypothetical protein
VGGGGVAAELCDAFLIMCGDRFSPLQQTQTKSTFSYGLANRCKSLNQHFNKERRRRRRIHLALTAVPFPRDIEFEGFPYFLSTPLAKVIINAIWLLYIIIQLLYDFV